MRITLGRQPIVFLVWTVAVSLLALGPGTAGAVLVEVDLFAAGDGLLTRDTVTGLEWLDLTETVGLSYSAVASGAGGWTALGFSFANTTQVVTLFADAGLDTGAGTEAVFSVSQVPGVTLLVNLMGLTGLDFAQAWAETDPLSGSVRGSLYVLHASDAAYGCITVGCARTKGVDDVGDTIGSWLIRPASQSVPEPSTLLLLGSGLAWLGGTAWRRRR